MSQRLQGDSGSDSPYNDVNGTASCNPCGLLSRLLNCLPRWATFGRKKTLTITEELDGVDSIEMPVIDLTVKESNCGQTDTLTTTRENQPTVDEMPTGVEMHKIGKTLKRNKFIVISVIILVSTFAIIAAIVAIGKDAGYRNNYIFTTQCLSSCRCFGRDRLEI